MTRSLFHGARRPLVLSLGGLLLLASACKKEEPKSDVAEPVAQPVAAPAPDPQPEKLKKSMTPGGHHVPVGPQLVLLPGQGAGPIRFGATFETVERHMGIPCDIRTEERCAYIREAIDFKMKEGVVSELTVRRRGRKVEAAPQDKEQEYGSFHGLLRPRIMLGLHQRVVLEEYGEPQKKEPLTGKEGQVELHSYDGVRFEYDKIKNGNTVLAAITIYPSETAPEHPKLGAAQAGKKAVTAPAAKSAPKKAAAPAAP